MDIAYRASAVQPFPLLGLMWVDDTIVILERGDTRHIQGRVLDQRTYYQGGLRVDLPDRKSSTVGHPTPRSPTPAAVAQHVGHTCATNSPERREEALAGALEIQPFWVLRHMGRDIYLQGTPMDPRNLPEVRTAV